MYSIIVLYGTESFNSESLAEQAGAALTARGYAAKVLSMEDLDPPQLSVLRHVLIITSTYGNGDPPYNAEDLHAWVMSEDAPELPGLAFAVCALGDTAYPHFAQCGKDFDARLGALGARRLVERVDCDVDYEAPFQDWLEQVLVALEGESLAGLDAEVELGADLTGAAAPTAITGPAEAPPTSPRPALTPPWGTRARPCPARVVANFDLHRPGATRETRQVTLAFGDDPPPFECGDSIGLYPINPPDAVAAIVAAIGADAAAPVEVGGASLTLGEALRARLDLARIETPLLQAVAGHDPRFAGMAANPAWRQQLTAEQHVADVLGTARPPFAPQTLVDLLRPLAPRLYSVASSPLVHPDRVDLMVAIERYTLAGTARMGVTSRWIVEDCPPETVVPAYLHAAPGFRPPEDPKTPLIMVGNGTGLAPFRAFLQARAAQGVGGRAWLFFGHRNEATDSLYADELDAWLADGVLTRLDRVFSRDQTPKAYVQDRVRQQGADVTAWLDDGAAIYVCGDAHGMAPGVHAALIEVLGTHRMLDEDAATARLAEAEAAGLYRRDVY